MRSHECKSPLRLLKHVKTSTVVETLLGNARRLVHNNHLPKARQKIPPAAHMDGGAVRSSHGCTAVETHSQHFGAARIAVGRAAILNRLDVTPSRKDWVALISFWLVRAVKMIIDATSQNACELFAVDTVSTQLRANAAVSHAKNTVGGAKAAHAVCIGLSQPFTKG
eukprot:m.838662 g.838662  ORF g.838662 m.838662 type:complete len:167 (+) comp23463_c0_seq5:707-1207(+)